MYTLCTIDCYQVKLQKEKDSVAEVQHSDVSSVTSDSEGVKARSRSIEEQLTQPEVGERSHSNGRCTM